MTWRSLRATNQNRQPSRWESKLVVACETATLLIRSTRTIVQCPPQRFGRVSYIGFTRFASQNGNPELVPQSYPLEHYEYWRMQVPEMPATLGAFGENLTTRGVLEKHLHIGDQVRVGSALLRVSQPRMPCYKLQVRFDREDMTRLFALSRRSGFYFSVIEEGEVKAGDAIEVVERDKHRVSIADVNGLYFDRPIDRELVKRALQVPGLTAESRSMVLSRLGQIDSN
ncbi:MAG: MOSC domain-containing protein [Candidatus Korobacteraceae bacterium]